MDHCSSICIPDIVFSIGQFVGVFLAVALAVSALCGLLWFVDKSDQQAWQDAYHQEQWRAKNVRQMELRTLSGEDFALLEVRVARENTRRDEARRAEDARLAHERRMAIAMQSQTGAWTCVDKCDG